ncbi:MAG: hypothetical protein A2Y17_01020 [Clostridiales bacterium GWF2_38_85]|nr:MAG: hypothetical protein A2Y17_01020 [Clostridiales bacterium GWF2_38_85]HBL84530.1 hypothetical protein [Clostridiales bacterium]
MKRRIFAMIVLTMMLTSLIAMTVSAAFVWEPWQEEIDAAVGFEWVLVDVLDYDISNDDYFDTSNTYSRNNFSFSFTADDCSASSAITFSVPPSSFKGGEIIKIDVTNTLISKYREGDGSYNYSSNAKVMMGEYDLSPATPSTTTRTFEPEDGISGLGVGGMYNEATEASATLVAIAAYGKNKGDKIGIHLYGLGCGLMQTTYVYEWKNTEGDRWVLLKTEEYNIDDYVSAMNVDHMVDGQHVIRTHTHFYTEGRIIDTQTWNIDGSERYIEVEFTWGTPPNVIVVGKENEVKIFYSVSFSANSVISADGAHAQITMRADGPSDDGYTHDDTYHSFDFIGENTGTGLSIDKDMTSLSDTASPNGNVAKPKVMVEGAVMKIYVEGGLYGGGVIYTYGFAPKGTPICDVSIGDTSTVISGGADIVINTNATNSAGETGVSVPALIAVGALSVAAALGAAGASGGGTNGENNEEDKNGKRYKMYIRKDFGDSIRYNKPGVTVYARMVEISKEGEETDRFDLTQNIEIFSGSNALKVRDTTIAGNYMGAIVEAESMSNTDNPTDGIVSFKFTGEGGSFQDNVKFRLVGDPYIKFDEQGDYLSMTVNMIEGDDGEYIVPFTLVDFMEVPKVELKLQDESPFDAELEKVDDFHYKAKLRNTSTKSEKPNDRSKTFSVEVMAESEHDYKSDYFNAIIYPEGITVSVIRFDDNDYAQIGAYEDKEREEGGEVVMATSFKLELAVSTVDANDRIKAELVDLSKLDVKFDKLKGTDTRAENLATVFKYEIEPTNNAGIYKFQPKMQIPEGDSKHYLTFPISCEYQNKPYNLDLPVRLIGEPFNEMKAKKEELDLLLKRIRKYMPPEDWSSVINNIKENYDRMSPKEIRLLNRSLYEITARTLYDESQANINYAETLDWVIWGLEWVKWVGDQAFSYVAAAYTGPVGEALLTPTKEIMVQLIAENIWYREGITSPADKLRGVNTSLMAMMENMLMTQIDKDTSLKKVGMILASFTVIKIVNHYFNDIGSDGKPIGFYDAILAGLGDLTVNAFKMIVSNKFEEMANNPKAKEYFQKYVGEWLKKFLDANAAGWRGKDGFDLVKKYVEETFGLIAAKAYTKATQIELEEKPGSLIVKINVWDYPGRPNDSIIVAIDVMNVKEQIFDYMFDMIFGSFPFTSAPLNPPADPPFIMQS